ncbi:MAG TPA: lysine-2,3-aminomutase-like protein [Stellaceae bacterium]|nr:lysine-2,3-aminomutase-like protein [Stellaceae bacterium]
MERGVALRTAADLITGGLIAPERRAEIERVSAQFSLAITPDMAELIDPADPADPIAAQFVPQAAELTIAPEERGDPIGDEAHSPMKGIVHRYPDRVLLKPLHVCPVYCRFCFRREMVGPGGAALTEAELAASLDYIRARPEIWEVIVTGGDPFMLAPRRLAAIVSALDAIPHLGVIRLHTRVPVVDPDRVSEKLVAALAAEKAVFVAIHANHPRELTPAAREACRRLVAAGIPLLSQTVLLKGVNDDAATLTDLMRGLVAMRVKPYYLHHGDLARGTAHFRTTIAAGQAIQREMRFRVSGLCQPSYVLDLPGGDGKVPIGPSYLSDLGDGRLLVEDRDGVSRAYPPPADIERKN